MAAIGTKSRTDKARAKATNPPDVQALKKLRIVIRCAQRHSSKIERRLGITGAQLWTMQELHEAPGLRVNDIASRLSIHQTTASNLLNLLVKKGYIDKLRDPDDQRVVKLVLSKSGAALLKHAPGPARGLLPDALSRLDKARLRKLIDGLQGLLDVMEAVDEENAMEPLPFTM